MASRLVSLLVAGLLASATTARTLTAASAVNISSQRSSGPKALLQDRELNANATNLENPTPYIAFKHAVEAGTKFAREHIDLSASLCCIAASYDSSPYARSDHPKLELYFESIPFVSLATHEFYTTTNPPGPFGVNWLGPIPWPASETITLRGKKKFGPEDIGLDLVTAWDKCLRRRWRYPLERFILVSGTMQGHEDVWYFFPAGRNVNIMMAVGSRTESVFLIRRHSNSPTLTQTWEGDLNLSMAIATA